MHHLLIRAVKQWGNLAAVLVSACKLSYDKLFQMAKPDASRMCPRLGKTESLDNQGHGLYRLAPGMLGALRGRRVVEGRENGDGTVTISKTDFDLLRLKDHAFDNVKEVRCGCWLAGKQLPLHMMAMLHTAYMMLTRANSKHRPA